MGIEENDMKINLILASLGLPDLKSLSLHEQKYIREAEQFFISVNNDRRDTLKAYKKLRISVKLVAEKLCIERQTIYNNKVLSEYIKNAQIIQSKDDIFDKMKNMQSKVKNLDHELKLLIERDVTIEFLKEEISDLNGRLLEKNIEIEELQIQKNSFQLQVDKLEQGIKKKNNNIFKLNK